MLEGVGFVLLPFLLLLLVIVDRWRRRGRGRGETNLTLREQRVDGLLAAYIQTTIEWLACFDHLSANGETDTIATWPQLAD